MTDPEFYLGREQTLIKHFILRKYLERFAHIIGFAWKTITYVDCFSGPWKTQSDKFTDTSFAIALEELRRARQTHESKGKSIELRCMFLEKDKDAYAKLKEFADHVKDLTVETRNRELADAVPDITAFVQQGGPSSFPFIFIDPTGWKGFEMKTIAPLLRFRPGEVLINFMTDYIRRFIEHPQQPTRQQFSALFGSADVKDTVQHLTEKQDREDALFQTYADNVRVTGGFQHTCAAIVFHPTKDRSYFHLIYATRHRRGVEVFKGVEQRAMEVQEQTRADAKQRKRVKRTGERELFSGVEMPHTRPIDTLRDRYLKNARAAVQELLQTSARLPYERVWDLALSYPLVWECDLKDWIKNWKADTSLKLEGMKPREKVPKLDENIFLLWQKTAQE
jgi:three-Cys-motif partner protein